MSFTEHKMLKEQSSLSFFKPKMSRTLGEASLDFEVLIKKKDKVYKLFKKEEYLRILDTLYCV